MAPGSVESRVLKGIDDKSAKEEQFRILQKIVDKQSRHVEEMEEKIRAEEKEKSERHLSIVFQQVDEARKDLAQFETDKESARAAWAKGENAEARTSASREAASTRAGHFTSGWGSVRSGASMEGHASASLVVPSGRTSLCG